MSDYNWCHGPKCHKNKTQDRIRGVKGSKVLRTKKIAENNGTRTMSGLIFVVKVVGMISCMNIGTSSLDYTQEPRHLKHQSRTLVKETGVIGGNPLDKKK